MFSFITSGRVKILKYQAYLDGWYQSDLTKRAITRPPPMCDEANGFSVAPKVPPVATVNTEA